MISYVICGWWEGSDAAPRSMTVTKSKNVRTERSETNDDTH